MIYQKRFAPGVISGLKELIKNEDNSLTKAYLNQNEFVYSFDPEDFEDCDFLEIANDLGNKLVETFLENLNPGKKNDFRKADFECAKLLYESLKLTPRQAADIDFWNYLHHFDFYKYIHKRWSGVSELDGQNLSSYIIRRWLMTLSSQGHLINYPLTTLWWSIHLTIDRSRNDVYELSRIYFNNNRYRTVTFGGSSFVRHPEAILGILEYYLKYSIPETKETGDDIGKFINLLGGTKPLGFFDRSWFVEKLEERVQRKTSKINIKTDLFNLDRIQERKNQTISPENIIFTNGSHSANERNEAQAEIDFNADDKTILCYFNLSSTGAYSLNDRPIDSCEYALPIYKGLENGYLLQGYSNGRVNKVPVEVLLNKRRNRKVPYTNGIHKSGELIFLKLIPEESLLLVTSRENDAGCFAKIHRTEWVSSHNQLHSMGNEITKNIESLSFKSLSIRLENDLKKLIKKSSHTKIDVNNNYYKKEWTIVKKFKSDLCN